MTENEALILIQAIPSKIWEQLQPCDDEAIGMAYKALEEIQQYRAIGTVEGYKRALKISKENFRVSMEYKAKVQAFEAIGTIEEFKALKEDGRFLEFLYNHILPNEMEQYLSMYQMKDKVAVNGYADQSGLMPAT